MRACTRYDSRRGTASGLSQIEVESTETLRVGAVVVTEASICFPCLAYSSRNNTVSSVNPTNGGKRAGISPQKSKKTRFKIC